MVFENGYPRWMGGTPGGDQQPQWNVQVITNLIDFGLNVQQAAEYPRWFSHPGTDEAHLQHPFQLKMENRFQEQVYQSLKDKGHQLSLLGPWGGGGVQLIEINRQSGVLLGGSDPRIGGIALGF
jgi:gamma-glutamyltranspeptidase/glutathione hydrolase